jgi:hypothetical protein
MLCTYTVFVWVYFICVGISYLCRYIVFGRVYFIFMGISCLCIL